MLSDGLFICNYIYIVTNKKLDDGAMSVNIWQTCHFSIMKVQDLMFRRL